MDIPAQSIRGPRGLPYLGVALQFSPEWLLAIHREYGDTFMLNLPFGKGLVFTHPNDVHEILLHPQFSQVLMTSNAKSFYARIIGQGLFGIEGEAWLRQRRLMQPAFHKQAIATYFDMMLKEIESICDEYANLSQEGTAIDLNESMTQITARIISNMLFSKSLDNIDKAILYQSIQIAIESIPLTIDPPLSPWRRHKFNQALGFLDDFIYSIIDQRQAQKGELPDDLLTTLIQARDADSGQLMNRKQLRDEVMTLFLAGHETTSKTLTWLFYTLNQHPPTEAKLLTELAELDETNLSPETLNKLSYTSMVVNETLRLYPVAWILMREAEAAITINGYQIEKGEIVYISPFVTHRHGSFWDNPEKFIPERFTHKEGVNRFSYFPFGGGRRICIGKHFALMEAQLVLAVLAKHFCFEFIDSNSVGFKTGLALSPDHPLLVRIHPR